MLVDRDKLRHNVEASTQLFSSDPATGHVRPRVSTRLVEDVSAVSDFVQYGKSFSFRCDEAEDRAGKGEHPSPLRYFLSGLAFCQQVWYAKGSAIVDCELDDLRLDVLTYMDQRGEHLIGDVPQYPQWIIIDADVTSGSSSEAVLAMVDEANRRCPVYGLVSRAVPIYDRIVHNGITIRNGVPDGVA